MTSTTSDPKQQVHDFWDRASCGEEAGLPAPTAEGFQAHAAWRYELEPFIEGFADFAASTGRRVLEIGVGLGADHQRYAEAGAILTGIDLTERAVAFTRQRLETTGHTPDVHVGDAEALPFDADTFDIVYSWGVLHHSPDTPRAIDEVWRVLKPGGEARVMVYDKWPLVGLMLWARYAAMRLRPFTPLRTIYARHLESPGTKAYTRREARRLFARFANVRVQTELSGGDLLAPHTGQRHRGGVLSFAKKVWPRWLIRRLGKRRGLFLMIRATKPAM